METKVRLEASLSKFIKELALDKEIEQILSQMSEESANEVIDLATYGYSAGWRDCAKAHEQQTTEQQSLTA